MKCNIREQCICGQHRKFHLVIPIGSSLFVMRSDHNDYQHQYFCNPIWEKSDPSKIPSVSSIKFFSALIMILGGDSAENDDDLRIC